MENDSATVGLARFMCVLINMPESRVDCADDDDAANNRSSPSCVRCTVAGSFISGEGLDDTTSGGHVTVLLLTLLTVLVGACGILCSALIITVLRRRAGAKSSFDILLAVLAHVDLLCCLAVAACTTSMVVFWQNWSRGLVTLVVYLSTVIIAMFARSASCFVTVVIAVERYLVLAFPMSASAWFTPTKTKVAAGGAVLLAFLLGVVPRSTSVYIGANRFVGVGSVAGLDYLIYKSEFEQFWYVGKKGVFDLVEFWGPLPLLLVFNGLIYYQIRQLSSRRVQLNMRLRKELRAGQVVLPVVVVLFSCNIVIVVTYYFVFSHLVNYREGFVAGFLSAALNSAANLPIYYMKAPGFKEEARQVLREWFSWLPMPKSSEENSSSNKNKGRAAFCASNPSVAASCQTCDDDDDDSQV